MIIQPFHKNLRGGCFLAVDGYIVLYPDTLALINMCLGARAPGYFKNSLTKSRQKLSRAKTSPPVST